MSMTRCISTLLTLLRYVLFNLKDMVYMLRVETTLVCNTALRSFE